MANTIKNFENLTGKIPGIGLVGKRFAIDAQEGLLEFERTTLRKKNERNNLIREIEADQGKTVPTLEEKEVIINHCS